MKTSQKKGLNPTRAKALPLVNSSKCSQKVAQVRETNFFCKATEKGGMMITTDKDNYELRDNYQNLPESTASKSSDVENCRW